MQGPDRKRYDLVEVPSGKGIEAGQYLAVEGAIAFHLRDVKKFDAPKASLFALIIDGILTRKLPWSLVGVGVMISIVMELCGVASLPFAVGVYLPISTSVPIFVGGILRYIVDHRRKGTGDEDFSPGTLLSSGYIAGGTIAGLVSALVQGLGKDGDVDLSKKIGEYATHGMSGVVWFAAIGVGLYLVATRAKGAIEGAAPAVAEGGSKGESDGDAGPKSGGDDAGDGGAKEA